MNCIFVDTIGTYLNMKYVKICVPTALMITAHCHLALPSFKSYDPLCGYDCSPQVESGNRPRHSHITWCIQMWVTHLIVEIENHLTSMLTHGPLYIYLPFTPTPVVQQQFH